MNTMYVFLTGLLIAGGGIQKTNQESKDLYRGICVRISIKNFKRIVAIGYGSIL